MSTYRNLFTVCGYKLRSDQRAYGSESVEKEGWFDRWLHVSSSMLKQSHCRVACDRPTEIEGIAFNRATEEWPHSTLFCSYKTKDSGFLTYE